MENKKEWPDWTSVETELPGDDGMKLVACKSKAGLWNINRAYYMNGFWHGSGSMANVTHWMELPPHPGECE